MTILKTERLVLRPPEDRDLDGLFAIFSNPLAMEFWSCLPHTSKDETQLQLDHMKSVWDGDGTQFMIEYNGVVIGEAGIWKPPEIGYIFHPDYWRQGFATEALTAVIALAFHDGLERITADIDPRNVASIALLEKLGFREFDRKSRTFKLGDTWCDSVYYELLKPSSTLVE